MWCNINSERGFRGIYRYNIFENEGNIWGVVDWRPNHYDSAAYNNTFYIGQNTMGSGKWMIANANGGNNAPNAKFVNNIFYSENPIPFGNTLRGATWSSNIFYNVTGAPSNNNNQTVTDGSTLLENPGCGGNGKINELDGYMLTADSPAIDAGETVTIPAIWNTLKSVFKEKFGSEIGDDRDYFGNDLVDGAPDIGAAEYGKANNAGAVLAKMTDSSLEQQKRDLQAAIDAYQKDDSEENRKALEDACNQALQAVTAVNLIKQAEEELKNEVSLTVYSDLREAYEACKEMIETGKLENVDKATIKALKDALQALDAFRKNLKITASFENGQLTLTASDSELEIRYTTDGNAVSVISSVYTEPITLPAKSIEVKAALHVGTTRMSEEFTFSWNGANLALGKTATSNVADWGRGYTPDLAVDGDANTKWAPKSRTPELTVDLGQNYTICQISVQQDSWNRSRAFELLVSEDGETWTTAYTTDAMQQNATYDFEAVSARYVKLHITSSIGEANICEFGVYAAPEAGKSADMTELNEQITAAETVQGSEAYKAATDAKRSALELYLQIAKDVAANKNSDQQTVDTAAERLKDAVEAIEASAPQPGVVPVTGITLNRSMLTLTEGEQVTLYATVLPEDATNKSVMWTSSDVTVAVVDVNGRVTAVRNGKATIRVITVDGGHVATCEVTVMPEKHNDNMGSAIGGALISGLGGDDLPFGDVSFRNYYYDAVKWAVERGITSGTSSYAFSPDAACTRAQTVTFLWRAAGSPKATMQNNPFTDVHVNDYFYDAVLWAVENGITNGTSKTTFSPDDTVTRAQVVTFLWRVEGQPAAADSGFTDVSANAYYAKAIDWAFACGITTGMNYGAFGPDAACTRAQIVTFLYRNGK